MQMLKKTGMMPIEILITSVSEVKSWPTTWSDQNLNAAPLFKHLTRLLL
jgi:hypothetical protein